MWRFLGKNRIFLKIKLSMRVEIILLILLSVSDIRSLRNGEKVQKNSFCYVVSIWVYELFEFKFHCSGIIISESHILTAAHCVHDIMPNDIIVDLPIDCTPSEYPAMFVDTVTYHRDSRRVTYPDKPTTEYWIHDIAILRLMCDLPLASMPNLIIIAVDRRPSFRNNGEVCFITGWDTMNMNTSHLVLNRARTEVFENETWLSNSFLLPHEIYAFFTKSRALIDDVDSGNALVCGGKAVGIIVGGRDRTRSIVSVLTIAPYKNFISDTMRGFPLIVTD